MVQIGSSNVNKTYENKVCTGITFTYFDKDLHQVLAFNLKARVEEAFEILWREVKRPKEETRERIKEQALRTAWKLLSDWTEVQCSMIMLAQAKPLQLFLPFV